MAYCLVRLAYKALKGICRPGETKVSNDITINTQDQFVIVLKKLGNKCLLEAGK